MLKRLDGLSKVLDGDAAKGMDFLLARLSGLRKQWEKDDVVEPKPAYFAVGDADILAAATCGAAPEHKIYPRLVCPHRPVLRGHWYFASRRRTIHPPSTWSFKIAVKFGAVLKSTSTWGPTAAGAILNRAPIRKAYSSSSYVWRLHPARTVDFVAERFDRTAPHLALCRLDQRQRRRLLCLRHV